MILVAALIFLDWFSLTETTLRVDDNEGWLCGVGEFECTGFDTFPILRWLLIAAATAPLVLAWIVVRGHKLSWAPGELTMVVGFTAFVLILYNGFIDKPGQGPDEIGIGLDAALNDAPSGTDATLRLNEDETYTLAAADFGFGDPAEGDDFAGVVITSLPTAGVLVYDADGPGGESGVPVSAGQFVTAAQLAAHALIYVPAADGNGEGYDSFTFQVRDDGGTDNGGQDTDQSPNVVTFNVVPINDAPVLDLNVNEMGTGATLSYAENDPVAPIAPDATVNDVDHPDYENGRLSVRITNGVDGEDELSIINQGTGAGEIGYASGIITYEGVGSAIWCLREYRVRQSPSTWISTKQASRPPQSRRWSGRSATGISSDDPSAASRDVEFSLQEPTASGALTTVSTATITVAPVDDVAVARNDAFTTDAVTTIAGPGANVFADNGAGVDTDPDSALTVTAVAGGTIGMQFALPSGALLTLNANGTFSYDPNGAFDATPAPGSGASNQPDQDSFIYELAGGSTATVTIAINGLDSNDFLLGTAGPDTLTGGIGNDIINGLADDDFIDGGQGTDTMSGGAGNDTYIVDNAGDVVIEQADGGSDIIYSSVSYALGAGSQVETLAARDIASTAALSLAGNELANTIIGNIGANYLDGGGGADVLAGFQGNDTYIVDNAGDVVIEQADGGSDIIYSSVSYALGAGSHVETLAARDIASTAALSLAGNELANTIMGNIGANYLDGGGGADVLAGFQGNDTYIVDNAGDVVIEQADGGSDIIYSSVSYALGAGSHVETLAARDIASTAALSLAGNELANTIMGNIGANYLDGGGGADVLAGFQGNDTYIVDNAGDVVIEQADGGSDIIYSSVSYALGAGSHVETLAARDIASTAALSLAGNELANTIMGNIGANYLDGGGGADVLAGFQGNDTYIVDNAGDVVIEQADGGSDIIYSSVSYALGAGSHVETLAARDIASTAALSLAGNELANTIMGNIGANYLDGGGGADVLAGFQGNDTFAFTTALGAGNVDFIVDFLSGADRIALDDAVFGGLAPGALPATAFHTGSVAADASDRIIYDAATGALYFDADGNGAGAQIQFATVHSGTTITASDFIVI